MAPVAEHGRRHPQLDVVAGEGDHDLVARQLDGEHVGDVEGAEVGDRGEEGGEVVGVDAGAEGVVVDLPEPGGAGDPAAIGDQLGIATGETQLDEVHRPIMAGGAVGGVVGRTSSGGVEHGEGPIGVLAGLDHGPLQRSGVEVVDRRIRRPLDVIDRGSVQMHVPFSHGDHATGPMWRTRDVRMTNHVGVVTMVRDDVTRV